MKISVWRSSFSHWVEKATGLPLVEVSEATCWKATNASPASAQNPNDAPDDGYPTISMGSPITPPLDWNLSGGSMGAALGAAHDIYTSNIPQPSCLLDPAQKLKY